MLIPFTLLLIGVGYLCYQAKDEVYLTDEESFKEKEDIYIGLDDLFIWIDKNIQRTNSIKLLFRTSNF